MTSVKNFEQFSKEKKDKLYELDYMRFIACLAVMAVHITATALDVNGYIHGSFPHMVMLIINRSLKFTTPVFIFLSGVTSFYSYRKKEFNYFSFIKKRLEKVLVAYLIWCVIYYLAYIKAGFYSFNLTFFIDNIIYGSMSYHLYFVVVIVQMYIVGPIFYKMLKDSNKKVIILIVFAIITMLCAEFLRFKYADRVFLKYMFFYMLGIYVTLERDNYLTFINRFKFVIVAGYLTVSAIYIAVTYYNLTIYMYIWFVFSVFSVFFVYYIGLIMKKSLSKFYSFIKLFGQSSYFIYLMHPLVLTFMIMYTDNNGILSVTKRLLIYSATVIPITIISCLLFTAVRNKIQKNKKAALAASSN